MESIVYALNNPSFGPLVMVCMDSVYAELLKDMVCHYVPFGVDTVRELVLSLKGTCILQG